MGWSFRIARIAGIEVRIHVTFLLLLAYFGYQGYQLNHTAAGAVASMVRVLSLFLNAILAIYAHAEKRRALEREAIAGLQRTLVE